MVEQAIQQPDDPLQQQQPQIRRRPQQQQQQEGPNPIPPPPPRPAVVAPKSKLPWFKIMLVLVLMFVVSSMQVVIVFLELIRTEEATLFNNNKKNSNNNANSNHKKHEDDYANEEEMSIRHEEEKMSIRQKHDENGVDGTNSDTGTTAASSSATGSDTPQTTFVKNIHPANPDDLFVRQYGSYYDKRNDDTSKTGQSIQTIRSACWNQVISSGILDWERTDTNPTIGSSSFVKKRHNYKRHTSSQHRSSSSSSRTTTTTATKQTKNSTAVSANTITYESFSLTSVSRFLSSLVSSRRWNEQETTSTTTTATASSNEVSDEIMEDEEKTEAVVESLLVENNVSQTENTSATNVLESDSGSSSSTSSMNENKENIHLGDTNDSRNIHDDNNMNNNTSGTGYILQNNYTNVELGLHSLRKAAELGHPYAQVLLANAYSAGYYPFIVGNDDFDFVSSSSSTTTFNQYNDYQRRLFDGLHINVGNNNTSTLPIKITDEWLLDSKNPMHTRAMILWHMAAQHGSIDAAIILANRLVTEHMTRTGTSSVLKRKQQQVKMKKGKDNTASSKAPTSSGGTMTATQAAEVEHEMCMYRLPYYAAAAHGIIDQLQTDPQSRGHVLPAKDKHLLYQIHLHGSTAHKLDEDNKPDERLEALEYYQVKARDLFTRYAQATSNDNGITNSNNGWSLSSIFTGRKGGSAATTSSSSEATTAAYTLARYYHHGIRGAEQNMTRALQYYEIAGYNGHWEAAGKAGMLYLWGIGTEQNVYKAHKLFRLGMPFGYNGCYDNYQTKVKQNEIEKQLQRNPTKITVDDIVLLERKVYLCDDTSLNGMGLLRLIGIPMIVSINIERAIDLFTLARDQGNSDATYNLAMIRLGWKTHYKSIHSNLTASSSNNNDDKGEATSSESEDVDDTNEDDENSINNNNGQTLAVDDILFEILTGGTKDGTNKRKGDSATGPNNKKKYDKTSRHFPTVSEYRQSLNELAIAASKMHIHANHRLAMIYEHGVQIPGPMVITAANKMKKNKNTGIQTEHSLQTIVPKDCTKATKHYKWIVEYASIDMNTRLRLAYKHYAAGNMIDSLRHYLYVGEMGSSMAQLNAAFLFDQGICLYLNQYQCASAAVRLWKAASAKGNGEASLRVGDYYYYGRFRETTNGNNNNNNNNNKKDEGNSTSSSTTGSFVGGTGGTLSTTTGRPFGWVQHILFPEEYIIPYLFQQIKSISYRVYQRIYDTILKTYNKNVAVGTIDGNNNNNNSNDNDTIQVHPVDDSSHQTTDTAVTPTFCSTNEDSAEQVCQVTDTAMVSINDDMSPQVSNYDETTLFDGNNNAKNGKSTTDAEAEAAAANANRMIIEMDLASAARFYRLAAERNKNPRAHYNLGFMYEWGLGLKQDFPLAKRHYDLARELALQSNEADVPIILALFALNVHEYAVKVYLSWEQWLHEQQQHRTFYSYLWTSLSSATTTTTSTTTSGTTTTTSSSSTNKRILELPSTSPTDDENEL